MSAEFSINGKNYRAGKLDAMRQFFVATKWADVLLPLANLKKDGGEKADSAEYARLITAFAMNIPREITEAVVGECLSVVQRELPNGTGWSAVWNAKAKQLQYEADTDFAEMLQIVWHVLDANRLTGFFSVAAPSAGGQTQSSQA